MRRLLRGYGRECLRAAPLMAVLLIAPLVGKMGSPDGYWCLLAGFVVGQLYTSYREIIDDWMRWKR